VEKRSKDLTDGYKRNCLAPTIKVQKRGRLRSKALTEFLTLGNMEEPPRAKVPADLNRKRGTDTSQAKRKEVVGLVSSD